MTAPLTPKEIAEAQRLVDEIPWCTRQHPNAKLPQRTVTECMRLFPRLLAVAKDQQRRIAELEALNGDLQQIRDQYT